MERLGVFKALGDNTRYAIYLEIARSGRPLSTAEIASVLVLHPNTVRPHLERMREAGLLEVVVDNRGTVGRPQHRYRPADDAPSLGLEPSSFRLLANLLAAAAAIGAVSSDQAADAGRAHGRISAEALGEQFPRTDAHRCIAALAEDQTSLGFDPATVDEGTTATIAFTRCPFQELAEAYPDLVCHLHRGMVEGFVEVAVGAELAAFHTLADRDPCRTSLTLR
ncbi:MAG TPA: helix-turn-helix domain-containing protein [Acidimicrobiales bacterium]|nr:helix-turn-helix domain-containing protein [Acidimicrobiales bacterium]